MARFIITLKIIVMPSTERFYLKEHEPWVGVSSSEFLRSEYIFTHTYKLWFHLIASSEF